MNYGWQGTVKEFLSLTSKELIQTLTHNVYGNVTVIIDLEERRKIESQQRAWLDCYDKLQNLLPAYEELNGYIIFEYNILRGSGRRPDVLILFPGEVLVIECKSYNKVDTSEYLQTELYVRDIQEYHSVVQEQQLQVTGVLFLTNHEDERLLSQPNFQIYIASKFSLALLLDRLVKRSEGEVTTATDFLGGIYSPSPSMLEAARAILNDEPLPQIKAIKSSNFEEVYATVQDVIKEAQTTNTHHLVLVSGEPGAGKTFLGLKIAHDTPSAVYLSGNGPLVEVLQDTLKNKTFVQGLYGYKHDFLRQRKVPQEHVIVFDEAQRAWDATKMNSPFSEPDVIMQIAQQQKSWSVVIGLIGDGQEIHLGEESGLMLWNEAIKNCDIHVHTKHKDELFTYALRHTTQQHLHLNCSLRSHSALRYYAFVNSLLANDIERALAYKNEVISQKYPILITRDLARLKTKLGNMYKEDNKTMGIVCASGADQLKDVPPIPFAARYVMPKYYTEYFNYPDSPYFCKKLQYSATEFQTQGLELDCAIVHWDEDLCWNGHRWQSSYVKEQAQNPHQMKINAYRVLLTRGRDATIIYIPPKVQLDKTWELFTDKLGISIL